MQPRTDVKFDETTFNRIKRTIRNMSVGRHNVSKEPGFALGLPDEVGIQLTNRCNLRCKHCFQWNDEGFYNTLSKPEQNEEIRIEIVDKILRETSSIRSNLYLWGGEPLCYSRWNLLASLLEKDPRWTVFCTNGIDIEKQMDSIVKISSHLAMLISVEGFESENDLVRGNGSYKKVMHNIELLLKLKRQGVFRGEVSVNCVINESMIGQLHDFAVMFEEMGINTLYLCFPWYISRETALDMDEYFVENFSWLRQLENTTMASWHAYQYRLRPELIQGLVHDLDKIRSRSWKIRLRFQPALENKEIEDFVLDREMTAQKKSQCIGMTSRMNVMSNGRVTVCKLFPEFEVGDLNNSSVSEIWKSSEFIKARTIIAQGLMPVCSKCILLYLHGV